MSMPAVHRARVCVRVCVCVCACALSGDQFNDRCAISKMAEIGETVRELVGEGKGDVLPSCHSVGQCLTAAQYPLTL